METVRADALQVGKSYRVLHDDLGLFFGRCTVVDGDFAGFEIVEGNRELELHGYRNGDGFYSKTQYFTVEKG
jgi:hypothetical protein